MRVSVTQSSSDAAAGCACPEEYLRRAGIVTHASARLERDEIVVRAAGEAAQESVPAGPQLAPPPPPAVVAELRGVSKSYGSRDVLRGLDATFPGGTLTAVTGPSGSGKTTLLHLLAGLELPTQGDVVVDATVVSDLDRAARAELRAGAIAFVGQEPGLTPFLSATRERRTGPGAAPRDRQRRRPGALRRRPLRARRPARLAALDRRARPRRDRPRARRQLPPDPRGRADLASRPDERNLGRRPARPSSPRNGHRRRGRHARSAAHRAGGRAATPRLARGRARSCSCATPAPRRRAPAPGSPSRPSRRASGGNRRPGCARSRRTAPPRGPADQPW